MVKVQTIVEIKSLYEEEEVKAPAGEVQQTGRTQRRGQDWRGQETGGGGGGEEAVKMLKKQEEEVKRQLS